MKTIDLNADLGEGFSWDDALMMIVTTVNVGCGAHAGRPELSVAVAARAHDLGLRVAAHPGYPDREGFGRRRIDVLPGGLPKGWLEGQLALFPYEAIKPHGAFYHDLKAGRWPDLRWDLPRIGFEISEGFADRGVDAEGRLLPRDHPRALIGNSAEAAVQALRLAPYVRTICLHGDTGGCVERARAVRDALEAAGWTLRA